MRTKAGNLSAIDAVSHGFFGRKGGNSCGIYASLNTGLGANEDKNITLANRQLVAGELRATRLVTPYQYHSAVAVAVETAWHWDSPPRADGLVTKRKGIAIGINTADCAPVLFADADGQVIGAAHAGWRGAIGGVLQATVAAMEQLGARRSRIVAAIGPAISQANYEVSEDFRQSFMQKDGGNARFFKPAKRDGHAMFDLTGYVQAQLERLCLASVEDLELCTYGDEERFFSYRRMCHRGEPDYGRQISAICLLS